MLRPSPYLLALCCLLFITHHTCFAQEICNNGIDDDGDGLVDLHDPNCNCRINVTGNLLQNGSFENFKNCPTNYSYTNDFDIIDNWQYGTYTNTNEADYYHNFNCRYDSGLVMLYMPPALPLPNGNAFVSVKQSVYMKPDLKETDIAKSYVGQCLQSPLLPNQQYTMSFYAGRFQSYDDHAFKFKNEPLTVAIFGHPDCNAAPFGPTFSKSNGCPANYAGWILLGEKTIISKGQWVQDKINFTVPENINLLEIGPGCRVINPSKDLPDSTTVLDYYVYYLDDIHIKLTKDFDFQYVTGKAPGTCLADSLLTVPYSAGYTYQWYKDSVAIIGATKNTYRLSSTEQYGNYNVRISNNVSCTTSEPFLVSADNLGNLRLPSDTTICINDTLHLAPPISGVSYIVNGTSSSEVNIIKDGSYVITASDGLGCSKNFSVSVTAEDCANAAVLMPNSFTPNADGINDYFRVPPESKIKITSFMIFDRWGKKVYSHTATSAGWDGRINGHPCDSGAYVYIISGVLHNRYRNIRGLVYLLR